MVPEGKYQYWKLSIFFFFVCFWLLPSTSQNFTFVHEVCFHGYLFPQPYHLLWFRQRWVLSTCEHMQGLQAPSCHRKNPLPAAISGKAWDKLHGTELQSPASSQTVMRAEHLVGKKEEELPE